MAGRSGQAGSFLSLHTTVVLLTGLVIGGLTALTGVHPATAVIGGLTTTEPAATSCAPSSGDLQNRVGPQAAWPDPAARQREDGRWSMRVRDASGDKARVPHVTWQ
ncbi:hypothetical protein OG562_23685 [Streptomyces sp. NBC_01275]|uniref:hypothetical protein n=1 Tax=Streptomyces sp. NBC_01275 TaxID=2903807 RepID=UPI002257DFBB|nr:hypothetical protein [Streptomyces sp. NBC_01275]MCX4763909.1 hypothetical protein [Streptomyces sp. NBC_01275]